MTAKKKFDVTEKVKQALLDGLKKNGLEWFKPWKPGAQHQPINHNSGRRYKGFNEFFLNATMKVEGYEYNEWDTLNSLVKRGFRVKKEELQNWTEVYTWKMSYCCFKPVGSGKWYSKLEECMEKEQCAENQVYTNYSMFYFRVYNISQVEGDISPRRLPIEEEDHSPIKTAEKMVANFKKANKGLKIREVSGDRACYSPTKDSITMPKRGQFKVIDGFYHTLFHEMIHSTGHKDRLAREGVVDFNYFGSERYAFEELIAESGAMVLSGLSGVSPNECSQAYVNGWVKAIEGESSKAIVSALTKSAKAVDYVLGVK